ESNLCETTNHKLGSQGVGNRATTGTPLQV
ncbi:hypothetical protein X975_19055, partial [Stegodyphus mimosarum]